MGNRHKIISDNSLTDQFKLFPAWIPPLPSEIFLKNMYLRATKKRLPPWRILFLFLCRDVASSDEGRINRHWGHPPSDKSESTNLANRAKEFLKSLLKRRWDTLTKIFHVTTRKPLWFVRSLTHTPRNLSHSRSLSVSDSFSLYLPLSLLPFHSVTLSWVGIGCCNYDRFGFQTTDNIWPFLIERGRINVHLWPKTFLTVKPLSRHRLLWPANTHIHTSSQELLTRSVHHPRPSHWRDSETKKLEGKHQKRFPQSVPFQKAEVLTHQSSDRSIVRKSRN